MFLFSRAHSSHTGVSLIETLVAIALFSIVAVAMLAAFTTLIAENRKSRTQKIVMDNVQATLDSMWREIRNSKEVVISGGGTRIQFEPSSGDGDAGTLNDQIAYTVTGGQVMRSLNGGASWQAMTAPEIKINKLFFQKVSSVPGVQTSILITLVGESGTDKKTASAFTLQTTAVARGGTKVTSSGSVCAAQVVSGFLSRLLFDEASSGSTPTVAADSASPMSAVLQNGVTWTNGKWCNAVNFDGIDDYINYPDSRRHDFDNLYHSGLTISAWIRPTSPGSGPRVGGELKTCENWKDYSHVVAGEAPSVDCPSGCIANTDWHGSADGWSFFITPNLQFGFRADNGTFRPPWRLSDPNIIKLNEWQHVAVTWDGDEHEYDPVNHKGNTDGIRLYINGDFEAPYAYEPEVDTSYNYGDDSRDSMEVGSCLSHIFDDGTYADTFFEGAIDDFRLYNRVLTGAEIKDLAQNSSFTIEVKDN